MPLASTAGPGSGRGAGPGDGVVRVTLLPGWSTERGTRMAALSIQLAPGWKTYWRAPGDAGIPPRFDWTGSRNLASVAFHWPRPEVHVTNGFRSIGYRDRLVLPVELTPARPGAPIRLKADLEIGVCQDICVPYRAALDTELVPGGRRDPAITAALSDRPATAREAGVGRVACEVTPTADGVRLTAQIDMPRLGPDEVAVFELPDQAIWISEAANHRDGARLTAVSDVVPPPGAPFLLDRSDLRITVLGGGRAVELSGCPGG